MSQISLVLVYDPDQHAPAGGDAAARLRSYLDGAVPLSGEGWPLSVEHPEGRVRVHPAEAPRLLEVQFARSLLDEEERARAARATEALLVEIEVAQDELPMSGLGRGLALVRPLLDGLIAVFDSEGSSVHPGHWASSVADAPVPPRPESLFAMHAVGGESGFRWIHTHGLSRFGLPELEVLEVPDDDASVVAHVVNAVAARIVLEGVPEPGQQVEWGQHIHAALVPWSEVSALSVTGGAADERDAMHPEENRVLVVGSPGDWHNLVDAIPQWGEHPVLYRSDWETGRMETLAAARWPLFVGVRKVLAELDDFRFVAKLAYAPDGGFREHLWFEVTDADVQFVVATLLNEPHQDMGLHQGDEGRHDIERLSDFSIYSPFGVFNPETLPQLAAWVDHQLSRTPSA